MIAFVRGRVAKVGPDLAVVDVGGVGYALQCAPATLAGLREGAETTVATSMVVREDSMTLFGFADDDERGMFELLQTASGVGPRLALSMLATLTPDELRRAVATEDYAALTAVSGVGKKGAQRIVLELRDRMTAPAGSTGLPDQRRTPSAPWRDQLSAALAGLGWSSREVDEAVSAVEPDAQRMQADAGQIDIPVLLRAALATLNRSEART